MKTATITEAKNGLSALIEEVKAGDTVLILDRGVPVARLSSAAAESPDDLDGRLKRLERKGIVKRGSGKISPDLLRRRPPKTRTGVSIVDIVLEERREGR
jgi:prevent-host-death family protein